MAVTTLWAQMRLANSTSIIAQRRMDRVRAANAAAGIKDIVASKGIVFEVDNASQLKGLDKHHQANKSMQSLACFEERFALRRNKLVRGALHEWWMSVLNTICPPDDDTSHLSPKEKRDKAMPFLTKDSFVRIVVMVCEALAAQEGDEHDEVAAIEMANEDWERDARAPVRPPSRQQRGEDSRVMPRETFLDSVFNLADLYTSSVSALEYATFLAELLAGCVMRDGGNFVFWIPERRPPHESPRAAVEESESEPSPPPPPAPEPEPSPAKRPVTPEPLAPTWVPPTPAPRPAAASPPVRPVASPQPRPAAPPPLSAPPLMAPPTTPDPATSHRHPPPAAAAPKLRGRVARTPSPPPAGSPPRTRSPLPPEVPTRNPANRCPVYSERRPLRQPRKSDLDYLPALPQFSGSARSRSKPPGMAYTLAGDAHEAHALYSNVEGASLDERAAREHALRMSERLDEATPHQRLSNIDPSAVRPSQRWGHQMLHARGPPGSGSSPSRPSGGDAAEGGSPRRSLTAKQQERQERRQVQRQRRAIIIVQKHSRRKASWAAFARVRRFLRTLQGRLRARRERANFLEARRAAGTVQKHVRRKAEQARFGLVIGAVRVLQCAVQRRRRRLAAARTSEGGGGGEGDGSDRQDHANDRQRALRQASVNQAGGSRAGGSRGGIGIAPWSSRGGTPFVSMHGGGAPKLFVRRSASESKLVPLSAPLSTPLSTPMLAGTARQGQWPLSTASSLGVLHGACEWECDVEAKGIASRLGQDTRAPAPWAAAASEASAGLVASDPLLSWTARAIGDFTPRAAVSAAHVASSLKYSRSSGAVDLPPGAVSGVLQRHQLSDRLATAMAQALAADLPSMPPSGNKGASKGSPSKGASKGSAGRDGGGATAGGRGGGHGLQGQHGQYDKPRSTDQTTRRAATDARKGTPGIPLWCCLLDPSGTAASTAELPRHRPRPMSHSHSHGSLLLASSAAQRALLPPSRGGRIVHLKHMSMPHEQQMRKERERTFADQCEAARHSGLHHLPLPPAARPTTVASLPALFAASYGW